MNSPVYMDYNASSPIRAEARRRLVLRSSWAAILPLSTASAGRHGG